MAAPASAREKREHGPNVDGELALASLAPETGTLSPILDSLREPVRIAVDEINFSGGVNGKPVRFVTGDDGSTAQTAAMTTRRFAKTDKVDAVVGPSSSGAAVGVIPVLRKQHLVACAASNMLEEIGRIPSGGYYFRVSPPDHLQA